MEEKCTLSIQPPRPGQLQKTIFYSSFTALFLALRHIFQHGYTGLSRFIEFSRNDRYGSGATTSKSEPLTFRSSWLNKGIRSSGATDIAHSIPLSATIIP